MSPETSEFDGSATSRFPAEELKKFQLDQKLPSLVVLLGSDLGLRIPLTKCETTIGRTLDADVMLHDDQISRRHVVIRCDPQRQTYTLLDLNSTNGTLVNNQRVSQAELKDGDKIFIGSTVLKFGLEDELDSEHRNVLSRWVFTDDLTGLVVKRRFYEELRFKIQHALERSQKLALLMMDLDGLKAINDVHGHAMGAFVISQAGQLIGEIVQPLGQACRFGGDEFVAFLLNHDLEQGRQVGERIRTAVREHRFEKDGKRLQLTISVGLAVLPDAAKEMDALNKAADEALYRAKAKGRNCVSD